MTDELDPQTQQHIDDSADVTADADAVTCDDIDLDDPFLDESDMTQALISSSTASGSFMPLRLKNLMPLNSGGLCEAEMTIPPSSSF